MVKRIVCFIGRDRSFFKSVSGSLQQGELLFGIAAENQINKAIACEVSRLQSVVEFETADSTDDGGFSKVLIAVVGQNLYSRVDSSRLHQIVVSIVIKVNDLKRTTSISLRWPERVVGTQADEFFKRTVAVALPPPNIVSELAAANDVNIPILVEVSDPKVTHPGTFVRQNSCFERSISIADHGVKQPRFVSGGKLLVEVPKQVRFAVVVDVGDREVFKFHFR